MRARRHRIALLVLLVGAVSMAFAVYIGLSTSLLGFDLTVSGIQAFILGLGPWGVARNGRTDGHSLRLYRFPPSWSRFPQA